MLIFVFLCMFYYFRTMKRLSIILCCLLSTMLCYATSTPFVDWPPDEQGGEDNRGITLLPTIDFRDGVVTIITPYQIDDVEVTIRDSQGNTIYYSFIPVIIVQHSIILPNSVIADLYSIQIAYGDIHLIGFF